MKSIKEKAEEYADEQNLRMTYNGFCDNCQQGFVAGANYVLEQIESLTKYSRWSAQDLYNLIEQLKK